MLGATCQDRDNRPEEIAYASSYIDPWKDLGGVFVIHNLSDSIVTSISDRKSFKPLPPANHREGIIIARNRGFSFLACWKKWW